MAGKRRNVVQSEESNNIPPEEIIQADFEGRCADAMDFHGIKQLLQQLFLKSHINLSDLSDMIIAQNTVGSVLKQSYDDDDEDDDDMDGDNDVFGLTTVLNITEKKDTECIQQLRNFVISQLESSNASESVKNGFKKIFANPSIQIGWILNERFINIPAKISEPLFDALDQDVKRAIAKKKNFAFDYYVMAIKLHKSQGETIYSNPEEKLFDDESDMKYEFSVQSQSDSGVTGQWDSDDVMVPYRKIILVKADKFPGILNQIKAFVS